MSRTGCASINPAAEQPGPERPAAEAPTAAGANAGPRLVVLSSLFPHPGQPIAGIFIQERMFRVARRLPVTVVVPVPWFPLQGLLRRWKPGFRPPAPRHEFRDGVEIFYPRFLCVPAVFKRLDGWFMALGVARLAARLVREGRCDLIDAHFGYPDGHAAVLLGRWFGRPVTVTWRGSEPRLAAVSWGRRHLARVLRRAARTFSVSESLRRVALELGGDPGKVQVVANGVDTERFRPEDRGAARQALHLPPEARILITVGGLVERKGQQRVIELMPELLHRHPDLHYLLVGGASGEGDGEQALRRQVQSLGLEGRVHFLGVVPPDRLRYVLSAADVSVLATRNEGWANVLLESMACGLPVVATDVGGNREVVSSDSVGIIVPFGRQDALLTALDRALQMSWDHHAIRAYAEENGWSGRVDALVEAFSELCPAEPGRQRDERAGIPAGRA